MISCHNVTHVTRDWRKRSCATMRGLLHFFYQRQKKNMTVDWSSKTSTAPRQAIGTKLRLTSEKQPENRPDFSRLHQSNQSYDLHYDLHNGGEWPTVPLQLLVRTRKAGCCTSPQPCRPAAAPRKTMRVRWHIRSTRYVLWLAVCIGASDASRRMDR